MTERWTHIRGWLIGISCCCLLLGIAIVIWPQASATVLCRILGLLSIGIGIYEIVRYSQLGFAGLFFRFDLALGICNILIGVSLLMPFSDSAFLPFAAGMYVLVGSIFHIQLAISICRYEMGAWVMSLILGLVGLAFSVFLFVDPFHGTTALMIFMGASLIISSIQNFYMIVCLSKIIRHSNGPEVIDAEWETIE